MILILVLIATFIISACVTIYVVGRRKKGLNLEELLRYREEGEKRVKEETANLKTLEDIDNPDENPVLDLLSPDSLTPVSPKPIIPGIPATNKPKPPFPLLPEVPDVTRLSVPSPKISKLLSGLKKEKSDEENSKSSWSVEPVKVDVKYELSKEDQSEISKRNEKAYKGVETSEGLNSKYMNRIPIAEGKSINLKVDKSAVNKSIDIDFSKILSSLKYLLGIPLVLIAWWFIYNNKFDFQYYFLSTAVYLFSVSITLYLTSGAVSKPKDEYTKIVVDNSKITTAKVLFSVAYVLELFGLVIASFQGSNINNLIGYIVLGLCFVAFGYGLSKKNRYVILLSLYVIAIELIAKLYDIFSKIFNGVPFWVYIVVAGLLLMDITFYVLAKVEKKEILQ